MTEKKFILKEATKKRCKIIDLDDKNRRRFLPVSLELFPYLYEADQIDFSIYFRIENQMVEFIRPAEISTELLGQIWAATMKSNTNVSVCILRSDHRKFESTIDSIRDKKITRLLKQDQTLDPKTLQLFSNLSSASQMIVKGGIDSHVATRAIEATASMVSNQISSEVAVGTLSRMIHADATLYDHSASVAMFSAIIATRHLTKPLEKKEAELVARCGLYHDAGKTCVPNHILNKPGTFTEEEFEIMKTHTILGYEEIKTSIEKGAPIEDIVARIALEHHERFTGCGYPNAKMGRLEDRSDGIHLYSRIVSIADVYSALLMKRVYKEAMDSQKALDIMRKTADADFDPEIFEPFYENVTASISYFKVKEKAVADRELVVLDDNESMVDAMQRFKGGSGPESKGG